MPTTEKNGDSGQTPSMLVSLLVFGMMIGLILLSVFLFPEEVDARPLQISMTLATLFALGTIFLAFIYLSKETLPGDEDAEAVYGIEPEDADLPEPQLSA